MKNAFFVTITAFLFSIVLVPSSQASGKEETYKDVKEICEAKWGEDYRMQKRCQKQEFGALDSLIKFGEKYKGTEVFGIMNKCVNKWTDGVGKVSYRMAMYCTEKQLAAFKSLRP